MTSITLHPYINDYQVLTAVIHVNSFTPVHPRTSSTLTKRADDKYSRDLSRDARYSKSCPVQRTWESKRRTYHHVRVITLFRGLTLSSYINIITHHSYLLSTPTKIQWTILELQYIPVHSWIYVWYLLIFLGSGCLTSRVKWNLIVGGLLQNEETNFFIGK